MYPRLKLLQKLLADDGVIFISIDDNEFANLKLVCNEIFGDKNFIATFVWEKRLNRENRKAISSRHDYLICYAKNIRFLYKGIIIKHNKTEPTYTKTSLFLCEKRRFFMARTEKGVVTTI